MIGISVAAKEEWNEVLNYFNIKQTEKYKYGEYFCELINNKEVIFYRSGCGKKNSSNSTNYMINNFNLKKIIVIGTCAGIDKSYSILDVILPNKAVQFDYLCLEEKQVFKIEYSVNLNNLEEIIIATSDVPILKKDISNLLYKNNITIADMESATIAYICKNNNIECIIIKGISDFPSNYNHIDENQISEYDKNVPIVMNKILTQYLKKVI